jgi:hypothetical protein
MQYSGQSTELLPNALSSIKLWSSDVNNLWSTIYATVLNDAENIIVGANANNSPHYSGVIKF